MRHVRIGRTDRKRKRKKTPFVCSDYRCIERKLRNVCCHQGANIAGCATFTRSTDMTLTTEPMGRAVSVFIFRSHAFQPPQVIFHTVTAIAGIRRCNVVEQRSIARPQLRKNIVEISVSGSINEDLTNP